MMEIRQLTRDSITQSVAIDLAGLKALTDPRRLRSDPMMSPQLVINELRPSVPTYRFEYSGLFDGERLIGIGETQGPIDAENDDVCEVGIWIHPDHDGPGFRRRLFDHIDERERELGRTRYWGWGDLDDEPTRAFWEDELGYTLAYDERISRCVLDELDMGLMQQWIDRAADRAHGYHLEHVRSPMPDDMIGYFAQALEAMNDAPIDDMVAERETFDVARAREIEQLHLATQSDYRAVIAIETATGAFAGYTAVRIPDLEPALSRQGDTVTIPDHRNRGIGRWIKAAMIQWIRSDRPEVRSLDTGNAESNRAMLAINEAMGFRDSMHHGIWHLVTD